MSIKTTFAGLLFAVLLIPQAGFAMSDDQILRTLNRHGAKENPFHIESICGVGTGMTYLLFVANEIRASAESVLIARFANGKTVELIRTYDPYPSLELGMDGTSLENEAVVFSASTTGDWDWFGEYKVHFKGGKFHYTLEEVSHAHGEPSKDRKTNKRSGILKVKALK